MFKKILDYLHERLCCHHEWKRIETINYYINKEDELPSKIVIVFRCSKCGHVQKIEL